MEANEGLSKGGNFKTPLTIFDAIQINKSENKESIKIAKKEVKESLQKKEASDSDFLFPISSLF